MSKALECKRVHDDHIARVTYEGNTPHNTLIVNKEYAWVGNPFSAQRPKEKATKRKKPYVSTICKVSFVFGTCGKCIRKQVIRVRFVSHPARTEPAQRPQSFGPHSPKSGTTGLRIRRTIRKPDAHDVAKKP